MDQAELHNAQVEPICRKYLELRSRLTPYLYTALRETTETGIPIMRALWLHHADDAVAVTRGDEYLWGRDILVAPVTEKGASSRRLYLPRGAWTDFWTEIPVEGGREVERAVDLATMPLYVRAGAVIPMGPIRQYVDEPVQGLAADPTTAPLTLVVYPGADGTSAWYDDDGRSFAYRAGAWTRVTMIWNDRARRLSLRLGPGSRPLAVSAQRIVVRLAGSAEHRSIVFSGRPLSVQL